MSRSGAPSKTNTATDHSKIEAILKITRLEFEPHLVCKPDESEVGHNGKHEQNDDLVGHE